MKQFTDCSGSCEDCLIHYIGGCLAGHGDNDFIQIRKKDAVKLINKNRINEDHIKRLKEKYKL